MNKPLDELYFTWLYGQVADARVADPSRTYWKILQVLYSTEFVWLVSNDDNRLEDGKDLRREFVRESRLIDVDRNWIEIGCSVLELMVGLSRRLAFQAGGEPHYWFWHLMENIGLQRYHDSRQLPEDRVADILNRVIYRTYNPNGLGGFFPLRRPKEDQRGLELWDQLSAYVQEQENVRGG